MAGSRSTRRDGSKELKRENGRHKKIVADQALDMAILKEAASAASPGGHA